MRRLVDHGREQADPSFFFREFAAPPGCAVDDQDAWTAANPALDDFLHRDALRATLRTSRESSFRRFRLGQWVDQVEGAWLPDGAWESVRRPGREIPDGADVVLGLDGSFSQTAPRWWRSPSRRSPTWRSSRCGVHGERLPGAGGRRRGGDPAGVPPVACPGGGLRPVPVDAQHAGDGGRRLAGGRVPAVAGPDDTGDHRRLRGGRERAADPLRRCAAGPHWGRGPVVHGPTW